MEEPMALDKELLDILACPDCKGDVEYKEAESVIVCLACGLRYPVRDGIPVMLVEEAERPQQSGKKAKEADTKEKETDDES
jgi:uncharacterized protein YbaR (Trm112 family)